MKWNLKKALPVMLAAVLAFGAPMGAKAESYTGGDDWNVSFSSEKKMVSSFKTSEMDDILRNLQPGDDATFEIDIKNENEETTRWYMTNKVLATLEDASSAAEGGAYSYLLTYSGPGGNTTLFDSETVGGEDVSEAGEGLYEATNALEDYIYLDTLTTGQSGTVTLKVTLEGETQGNDYQDTLAEIQMNFAVEIVEPDEVTVEADPQSATQSRSTPDDTTVRRNVVQTGDESDLSRYYIMGAVSGILLLALGIVSLSMRRKDAKASAGRKEAK